jgi:hypothetical protein
MVRGARRNRIVLAANGGSQTGGPNFVVLKLPRQVQLST